ncbi:MAG: hypothetical protein ACRC9K_12295 [Afipia sp.]
MTERLPEVLAEIAGLIGEVAAISIAAHKGGTRVYFPAKVENGHWLVEAVGIDKAKKLCDHFAVDRKRGQHIEIPLYVGGTYRQMIRRIAERVHKLEADDASSSEIARKLGVTQRTVHRHRSRHRGRRDKRQGNLF